MAQTIQDMGDNEFISQLAEEIKKNPPTDTNGGHNALMEDLANLTKEAYDYEFHDFKNEKYGAPKIVLREKLLELAQNVVDGKYDN
jgi:hypothetical protein